MLKLIDEIGKGKGRTCFLNPQDKTKVVKVIHDSSDKQTKREISVYKQLAKIPSINYEHFPKYYGEIETDKGIGYVFDLVQNDDGSESKPFHWYIKNGSKLEDFYPQLEELKSYLYDHSIIFCNDMSYEGNILAKEISDGSIKLIVIDGLGDSIYFQSVNNISYFMRRKIKRRWHRLMLRLKRFEAICNKQNC